MTIEEKAKRYDEALERAKRLTSDMTTLQKIREFIFPELAESEDERIRKSLIKFLTAIKIISESGRTTWAVRKEDAERCKSFLAYLERQKEPENTSASTMAPSCLEVKQKEQKEETLRDFIDNFPYSAEQKEQDWNKKPCLTCQEYEKGHKQGYTEGCTAGYNKAMKEFEQKEQNGEDGFLEDELSAFLQNYDKEYDDDAAVSDVARHFYEIGKKQKEQKPHTDEEKEYIRTIKSIISDFIRDKKPENLAYYQRIYDWLDGRHIEQKQVEKQDYSGLNDLERAIHCGFLSAGVENVPVTIIKETAKECLTQMKPVEWSDDLAKKEFLKDDVLGRKHLEGYIKGRNDALREISDFMESHFNPKEEKK